MNAPHSHVAHVINWQTVLTCLVPIPAVVTQVSKAMASFPVKVRYIKLRILFDGELGLELGTAILFAVHN